MGGIGMNQTGLTLVAFKTNPAGIKKPALTLVGLPTTTSAPANPELITDGGFELGLVAWTAATGTLEADELVIVHAGAHAAKLTNDGDSSGNLSQDKIVTASTNYVLKFWTRGDLLNSGVYRIYDNTNAAAIVDYTATGVAGIVYTELTVPFATPSGCVSLKVEVVAPGGTGDAYFDDVSLKAIT
jgi:hypothetical protein